MADEFDFKGKVAIVTGGGRGIGREIAESLAKHGAAVAITGRSKSHLDDTVAAIEKAGGKAVAYAADVSDEKAIRDLVAETERTLGPVDVLVSNSGVDGPFGPLWLNDTATWKRTLDTNLMGSVIVAQAVLLGMVERKSG